MTSFLTVEDLHFCDGKGSLFRSALLLALNSFHYLFATEEDKYYEEGYVDTHTLTEDTGLAHSAARQENSDASRLQDRSEMQKWRAMRRTISAADQIRQRNHVQLHWKSATWL